MVRSVLGILAVLFASAGLLAACGGDDDGGGGGSGGSDEQYVKDLCVAAGKFSDSLDKAFSGPTPSNAADAFSLFLNSLGKPYEEFSTAFKRANPPADLKDWHGKTAKDLDAAVKAVKDRKFDSPALKGLGDSPVPVLPDGPRQRLQKVAATTKECEKANLFEAD